MKKYRSLEKIERIRKVIVKLYKNWEIQNFRKYFWKFQKKNETLKWMSNNCKNSYYRIFVKHLKTLKKSIKSDKLRYKNKKRGKKFSIFETNWIWILKYGCNVLVMFKKFWGNPKLKCFIPSSQCGRDKGVYCFDFFLIFVESGMSLEVRYRHDFSLVFLSGY